MKDAKDLIPWQVTDISIRPYEGYWSFNPSIHFDGSVWRCVLRCCDYAMPDGVTIRSKTARSTGQQTKNAMVIFDPVSWAPAQVYKMHERDPFPRVSTPHVGYEDMRLFRTDKGGLQGIAASLHLQRDKQSKNQPPEQVLLSFDGEYNIVAAKPIRGDGWSGTPQKNWVPFDHCLEPRFLYSIGKGSLFDHEGSVHGERAVVKPSDSAVAVSPFVPPEGVERLRHDRELAERELAERQRIEHERAERERAERERAERERADRDRDRSRSSDRRTSLRTNIRGGDVQIVRGAKRVLDTSSSRVTSMRSRGTRAAGDSTRMMGTGRALLPKYEGLRGGTQLVRISEDAWLGIGHEMKFVSGKKYYWHTWYLVDARGKLTAVSEPMKLAPNGIEFAAGLAIDGDRAVVSFGVDDMECRLGETKLSAVMGVLRKI